MEQSPSREASQEISRFIWNPKVLYGVHRVPATVPVLIQMYPAHTFIHFSP
jgi:hypothetical protein